MKNKKVPPKPEAPAPQPLFSTHFEADARFLKTNTVHLKPGTTVNIEWLHPPQSYPEPLPLIDVVEPKASNSYGADAIAQASLEPLEVWENPETRHGYLIHLEHPEFTSLCPRSGYPDSGTIVIDYIPGDYTVELKAIKLYINSFRNRAISHEAVTNMIADRLEHDVKPIALRVIGDFMRRGGVKTVITVQRGEERSFPNYQAGTL